MKDVLLVFMLMTGFVPAFCQEESVYYSRIYTDTSSVVRNNYISDVAYDSVTGYVYATMSSFNNYYPDDPRPRMYTQLLMIDPANGDILDSYIDTFEEGIQHHYSLVTIIDSFIYWSGYSDQRDWSADMKSNSILLKTDRDLNPMWRIVFDYEFQESKFGIPYSLDNNGSFIYSFVVMTTSESALEYFPTYGVYNQYCKIDRDGVVYFDTVVLYDDYENFTNSPKFIKKDNGSFWMTGRDRASWDVNFHMQEVDSLFSFGSVQDLGWDFYEGSLNAIHRKRSEMEEAYYVTGYKSDGMGMKASGVTSKLDNEGYPLWLYTVEDDNVDCFFYDSELTGDNEVVMLGSGNMNYPGSIRSRGIVYKVDDEGVLMWIREIKENTDTSRAEYLHRFTLLPNGDMIAGGWTPGYDSSGLYTQYAWLVRIDQHGCQEPGCELLSTAVGFGSLNFSISPNPSDDGVFQLSLGDSLRDEVKIEVYDMSGAIIYERHVLHTDQITPIDISSYPKGIYFISLSSRAGRSVKKVVYR